MNLGYSNGIIEIIREYVKYFKKKTEKRLEVTSIIDSPKYQEFLFKVRQYYIKKSNTSEKVCPQCSYDPNQAIDYFWEALLGLKVLELF
ncbi:MAG: hypothetical protein ACTSR8_21750 [Promethearchaeota archaeon]